MLSVLFSPRTYLRAKDAVALLRQTKKWKIKDDIFALEISGGGKRVVVLGSAGMDKNTEYPTGADLLVFPYQGRADMDRTIVPFLTELVPRRVTIDHFDDAFPPVTHRVRTAGFVGTVKKHLPSADAFVPERGEWYEI